MTIQIAPNATDVKVTEKYLAVEFNGLGIRYDLPEGEQFATDERSVGMFQNAMRDAIALSSKPWQLEQLLNAYFNVNGKVTSEQL